MSLYYFLHIFLLLIEITQETVLNWFNLETPLEQKIRQYRDLYGIIPKQESAYIHEFLQNNQPESAFSFNTLALIIEGYWDKIRRTGLGLSEIDNLIVLIVLIRLLILAIRYNIITSFVITAISVFAAYLWYSTFISTLFTYENALFKNSLTLRLGIDSNQMRRIMLGKIKNNEYQLRLTNPFGIITYAIATGVVHEGHRIDPVSMIMSITPNWVPGRHYIEGTYYLLYREIIPMSVRLLVNFVNSFTAYAVYVIMTRVNKKYCPYLIRWHWTLLMLLKFLEPYIVHLINRINIYNYNVVYPRILEAEDFNMILTRSEFELSFLNYLCFTIIITHLAFILFAMFHALCGQYFYMPFFTENVELHIGERTKNDKYSGGYTAWQDQQFLRPGHKWKPRLWYGWFGRGTNKPNMVFVIVKFIFEIVTFPFYVIWKVTRKDDD